MSFRVVGLVVAAVVAVAVLGACNFREGASSEYGASPAPVTAVRN